MKRRKTGPHSNDQIRLGALAHVSESRPALNQYMTTVLDENQRRFYLNSLKFHQIDSRHANIKPAHAQSCKWLLNKSEYKDWLNPYKVEDHNGILWIKGKPAAGKSTIMKFAYSKFKRTTKDAVVISFYFNARGEGLEKTVEGMYRSLLFQLLSNAPELQHVLDILGPSGIDDYGSVKWETEKVKGLFGSAVENLGQRHLICFIDALDECDESEVREMVDFFKQLAQIAITSKTQIHICFSSRHYPHITIENVIELTLEGQEGHLQDIVNYVQSELRAGQSGIVKQIKDEIPRRASGIFLWAVLVVKMLQKEYDAGKVHALQSRFKQIPNGLFELFDDILGREGEQVDHLILCLQWILFARRPLKREELYFGLLSGLDAQTLSSWDPGDTTLQDMERFILHSSKGLAEVTKSKAQSVQFIHESVRDFLKEGRLETLSGKAFLEQGHERLKQCCQTYLRVDASEYLPLTTELPVAKSDAAEDIRRLANQRFPLLEYAVRNVLQHANAASRTGISQEEFVQDFAIQDWIRFDNIFEKHQIRRHTPEASLLYIFAEQNLPDLILIELQRVQHMEILGERYGFPLCAALAQGNEQAVRALLTPNTSAQSKVNSMVDLCLPPQAALTSLLDAHASISKRGQTPFSWALENGNETLAKSLLETGKVKVNSNNVLGLTPLAWAVSHGHEAMVRMLLETGKVEVDSKDINGRTPLSYAALSGCESVAKLLLETGKVEVDLKDYRGPTPFYLAVVNGNEAVARLLLKTGKVDVDSQQNCPQTLLWYAVLGGHEAVVKLLLETNKVNVNVRDVFGRTPLYIAKERHYASVVKLLLETGKVEVDSKARVG